MRDLTLRQVEVIRAVMMTGTIAGAAEYPQRLGARASAGW